MEIDLPKGRLSRPEIDGVMSLAANPPQLVGRAGLEGEEGRPTMIRGWTGAVVIKIGVETRGKVEEKMAKRLEI